MEKIRNKEEVTVQVTARLGLGTIITILFSTSCFAQVGNDTKTKSLAPLIDTSYLHHGTLFYAIIPSLQFTSSPALNSVLSNQNAPSLGKFYFMGGLGWEERWKRFAIGLDFSAGEYTNSNDKYELASTVLLSSITAKYYAIHSKDIGGIYPFAGVTALNQSVYLTDVTNQDNMNNLFNQSGSVNMHLSTGFVNLGIGFDLLDFTKEDAFYGSFKLGYRMNIGTDFDNKWYVNENRSIEGSPVEKLNAFYIQFAVGYSMNSFSHKQKRIFKG